jgi:hypothetical protein
MEKANIDPFGCVDSPMPNLARESFMGLRGSHTTNQDYASRVDSSEQDFLAHVSLFDQGLPFTPGGTSDSLQISSLESLIPTTNDRCEEEDKNSQEGEGAETGTRPPKKDQRGLHWKDKAQQGEACPQPSKGNKKWAIEVIVDITR